MAVQLTGEVGRSGRPEDVAIVQALLANIAEPGRAAFWTRPVDGRPGAALAEAVEAFQRRWVTAVVAGGSSETGIVAPGSRTLAALASLAPSVLNGLRAGSVSPVVLYAQDDPEGRAGRSHVDAARLPGATTVNLTAVQRAQGLLTQRRRLAVTIRRSGLAGDRWGFQVSLAGLTVVGPDGRPRTVDDRPEAVPAALWPLVDGEFAGFFEAGGGGDLTGPGTYRSRTPLDALRGDLDEAVFPRMEVPRPARHRTARLAAAALVSIGRVEPLTAAQRDEVNQLIAMVKADEPATARLLEERLRVMQYGFTPATLRYASNPQIRDYLKRSGLLEETLGAVGLFALLLIVGVGKPTSWFGVMFDVLSEGAEDNARRLYEERLRSAALGGPTVAGQSVPAGRGRKQHLFGLFGVTDADLEEDYPTRFAGTGRPAVRAQWLDRLLDLMERILARRGDGFGLRQEIDEHWLQDEGGRVSRRVRGRLLHVLTVSIEPTNPGNARLRSDPELAAYRRRLAAISGILGRIGFVGLLTDGFKRKTVTETLEFWASWCRWAADQHKEALAGAKEELRRRESAL